MIKETFFNIKNSLFGRKNATRYEGGSLGDKPMYEGDYVELDSAMDSGARKKVVIKQFVMEEFEDIKEILDALRSGTTIALINIAPLKEKDIVELKRAVSKLKKTTDALQGDIAGFGDDYIVATPEFAFVQRGKSDEMSAMSDEDSSEEDNI